MVNRSISPTSAAAAAMRNMLRETNSIRKSVEPCAASSARVLTGRMRSPYSRGGKRSIRPSAKLCSAAARSPFSGARRTDVTHPSPPSAEPVQNSRATDGATKAFGAVRCFAQ